MRILSKPEGIDDLLNNIDLNSSIDAFLSLDEPTGIADLRNKKNDLLNEIENYHTEMIERGHLSHNTRKNFSKSPKSAKKNRLHKLDTKTLRPKWNSMSLLWGFSLQDIRPLLQQSFITTVFISS